MLERIRNEPALVTGAVTALIALGVAFGLELSPEQTGAILAVVAAGLALVTRAQVTPTRKLGADHAPVVAALARLDDHRDDDPA